MESVYDKQYVALKFCVCLQKFATEAYKMLHKLYGEDIIPQSTAF